jgi:hypothetical protein
LKRTWYFSEKLNRTLVFWTSGANEDKFCDARNSLSWCAVGGFVKKQEVAMNWVDDNQLAAPNQRCLALKVDAGGKYGLQHTDSAVSKHAFICEV